MSSRSQNRRQFSVSHLVCPLCARKAPYGAVVCQGCKAEIVYGATTREQSNLKTGGFHLGLLIAFLLFTHTWWAYPVLGILGWIFLSGQSYYANDVRYFRRC